VALQQEGDGGGQAQAHAPARRGAVSVL
jgi:hypothetical protein